VPDRATIVTCTLNAALDRTLIAPGFTAGRSYTAAHAMQLGGGKGLNVARALRCLGHPVLALGFAGGHIGALMRRALDDEGMQHDLTPIARESRICTAILDPERGTATEVNEAGPAIEADEVAAFLVHFDRALSGARLVVLSGSLPRGIPHDFYAVLIARARSVGVPCFLDSRDAALRAGVAVAPLLIKPNQHEAADLLGGAFDPEDGAFVRGALPRPGPAVLGLTLGAEGAVLHGPSGSWRARPPSLHPVDTVGAGDAFLAGLAAALVPAAGDQPLERAIADPATLESMLRLATATAAASTLAVGAGRCDPADIARLAPAVAIARLSP
jgi:1-phosphofructokinase family hexose kinase